MLSLLLLSTLLVATQAASLHKLRDQPVEGLCDASVKSLSGYFQVNEEADKPADEKNYFFWFFESRSRPKTDPLIIWLTGGPGCSSQLALLTENGPCTVSEDGLRTVPNPYSWNNNANIMWVDQPAGVGYSYGSKTDRNESMVAEDMYHFVQHFLSAHPEYQKNGLFVFGESFGGHYAPAVTNRIFQGNLKREGLYVNLQGVGIGNGLTDPVIQYAYYPAMAMNNSYGIKTVSEEAYAKMVQRLPACELMARACQLEETACQYAYTYCNLVETTPYYSSGLNPYDIRKPCGDNDLCYNFTNIEIFLNLPETRAALHVSDRVKKWESCNTVVNAMFANDWMKNYQQKLIPMLEAGVRVLIYAGDVDFICNWMGNKAWTQALRWSGHEAFNAEQDRPWVYADEQRGAVEGGKARTASSKSGKGKLTFLQVYEAGHMVPMDQPQAALALLNTFLQDKEFY